MKKVLIFGGAGFVGSNLARQLTRSGDKVFIIDPLRKYRAQQTGLESAAFKRRTSFLEQNCWFQWQSIDSARAISSLLNQLEIDVVVNLAGVSLVSYAESHPSETYESTIQLNSRIVDALAAHSSIVRYIFTSSSTVYGDFKRDTVSEDEITTPFGLYAKAKLECEAEIAKILTSSDYVILRPTAIYGWGDINRRVVSNFIEAAVNSEKVIVRGARTMLDFTSVNDVVGLFQKAIHMETRVNDTFNVSFGEARSLNELIEILKTYFPNLMAVENRRDVNRPTRGTLCNEKAKSILQYRPNISLEKGIDMLLKDRADFIRSSNYGITQN